MMRSTRVSSALLGRLAVRSSAIPRRSFAISAVAKADIVQDLYLKELKAYKPTPPKASDAEAAVQKFTPPPAPRSPEEADLAASMQEYENQQVEIEGQAATGETAAPEEDYFEDMRVIDEEDSKVGHH